MSGVWIRLLLPTKPDISQSRHDRVQDSLTPGGDDHVIHKNIGWSRSPRAQGCLLLMLRVLQRIGQHLGHNDLSTVKRKEIECVCLILDCNVDIIIVIVHFYLAVSLCGSGKMLSFAVSYMYLSCHCINFWVMFNYSQYIMSFPLLLVTFWHSLVLKLMVLQPPAIALSTLSTWMYDYLRMGIPSRYVTSQLVRRDGLNS